MKDPNHSLALGFVGLLGLALFSAACTTGGDSTTDGDSTSSSSGGGASAGSAGGSGGVATTSGDGGNGGATTSSGEGGSATTTNGEGGSGGATTTNTSSSAGGAGGAGGTGGAATSSSSSSSSSTEVSCDELRAQLAAALDKAQACSLASTKPIAECNAVVAGLCCPTVVAREGSDEANAYLALLATLQGRGDCASGCPDVLCKEITGGTCEKDPGSSSGTIGVCVASNSIDM